MQYQERFDVIVVGGGHAGTEAALAAARLGMRTLLLTHSLETLGQLSCNPSIGGIGKGQLVREIDALGGLMAHATDRAGIQFRTLNASKGPAVRAIRAQVDRQIYRQVVRHALENQPNLWLFQQEAADLQLCDGRVCGVITRMGLRFSAPAVVLTVGTFLAGCIHIGLESAPGGRAGDPPSDHLAARLRELATYTGRLKTGTPPRLDGRTINWDMLATQDGDDPPPVFSFLGSAADHPRQVPCHITFTSEQTHEIIRGGLDRSPMYAGVIDGIGPRYCPSVEDKVVRFADRDRHQVFLEPEGLDTHEIYPNGISTSLPFEVQFALVRSIRGLEQAHIMRPGYAIEYDFFDPRDLRPTLESRQIGGLFLAGQINGTTGYEEAAAQGLLAGLNAARQVRGQDGWWPRRDEAYLGVMVDDLITCGTTEPYRMFTSRAEHRLLLREDNADLRLTPIGHEMGLVDERRWRAFSVKREAIERERQRLAGTWIRPQDIAADEAERVFGQSLTREHSLDELLRRPGVSYHSLMSLKAAGGGVDDAAVSEQVEIQAKYAGYIARQQEEIARQRRQEDMPLPQALDYHQVSGLSAEARDKLSRQRPATLGQAARIPGITPAVISLLLVYLKKHPAASRSA